MTDSLGLPLINSSNNVTAYKRCISGVLVWPIYIGLTVSKCIF